MSNMVKARIAYVGSALENGEMEIRELVPALLAFSDLVEYANRALGGEQKIKVMLNQDSLKRGSFDITFLLDTSIVEQAKLFFGFSSQTSLSTIVAALGWEELNKVATVVTITGGVFGFIKFLRGRTIKKVKKDKERSEIILDDGTKHSIDNNTLKIFLDVRTGVHKG